MSLAIGDYRVFKLLARGAATETMLVDNAAHTVTHVAKRLVPRLRADSLARAQLDAEARLLSALAGRGAPRVIERGEDGEGPWLVTELVSMTTLEARSAACVDAERRAECVTRVAAASFRALAAVHEADDLRGPLGVVHGDVSPDNLLVEEDPPDARLIDFGLAHGRDVPPVTAGTFRGTARYVAPEVARGELSSTRSDLFSLGLTLLYAASGELARPGDGLAPLLVRAGEESVLPYAERAAEHLGRELRDTLLAVVAFLPAGRPSSAREAWRRGPW